MRHQPLGESMLMRFVRFPILVRSVRPAVAIALTVALSGCDLLSPKVKRTGTLHMLNGVTNIAGPALRSNAGIVPVSGGSSSVLTDGQWKLTPQTMTASIVGIAFAKPGTASNDLEKDVEPVGSCTATYDQTKASLLPLSDCTFQVPEGTYGSVTLQYSKTYSAVISDAAAGIYSDPTSPNSLRTTAPVGGASSITVLDQNGPGTIVRETIYFTTPVVVDADHLPELSVVFNPIHWMVTTASNGSLGPITTSGNPPLIPSSTFGKAEFYSTLGSIQAFNSGSGCSTATSCVSILVLYADATTARSAAQIDGSPLLCSGGASLPNVSYDQDGTAWGTFGRLGLDAGGVLTWAMAGAMNSDNTAITGYRGVMQMAAQSTIGQSTTVSYQCTTSPPSPSGGASNYASGHPTITPTGSFSVTLRAH